MFKNALHGFVVVVLVVALSGLAEASEPRIKVRPFATVAYAAGDVWIGEYGSELSFGGGAQGTYRVFRSLSIGLEVGYLHAYTSTNGYGYDIWIDYLDILAVVDFTYHWLVAQLGLGPRIGVDWNDETCFGLMLAAGVDIPISTSVSIPLLFRADFVFENWGYGADGDGTVVPLGLMLGLTFKF